MENKNENREMIAYEEMGSQALYSIDIVDNHIEVEFFEDDAVLEYESLYDFVKADLKTFLRSELAQKKALEIIEEE